MNVKWRVGATLIIWAFMGSISILALIGAGGENSNIAGWVFTIPLVVGLFATFSVWDSGKRSAEQKSDNTAYTMALLMEMMDEDEREQFKYDLKRRVLSGEQLTNESLVEELEKRKRS